MIWYDLNCTKWRGTSDLFRGTSWNNAVKSVYKKRKFNFQWGLVINNHWRSPYRDNWRSCPKNFNLISMNWDWMDGGREGGGGRGPAGISVTVHIISTIPECGKFIRERELHSLQHQVAGPVNYYRQAVCILKIQAVLWHLLLGTKLLCSIISFLLFLSFSFLLLHILAKIYWLLRVISWSYVNGL